MRGFPKEDKVKNTTQKANNQIYEIWNFIMSRYLVLHTNYLLIL